MFRILWLRKETTLRKVVIAIIAPNDGEVTQNIFEQENKYNNVQFKILHIVMECGYRTLVHNLVMVT